MSQAFNLSQLANKVNASGQLDLATGGLGTLPNANLPVVDIAHGGTNNGSLPVTSGGVVYSDGTKLANTGAGTTGQFLISQGASPPQFQTINTGGLTLLGTIITTSGTSLSLTGLDLTPYKELVVYVDRVSNTSGIVSYNLRLAGLAISVGITNTFYGYGKFTLDLSTGAFFSGVGYSTTNGPNSTSFDSSSNAYQPRCGELAISTSTTSLTFDWSGSTSFDNGTIKVYGMS